MPPGLGVWGTGEHQLLLLECILIPRWPQDGTIMAPSGFKRSPKWPQEAQDGPKIAPRDPNMDPRCPKMTSRGPQEGPKMVPRGPKLWPHRPRGQPKRLQNDFKTAPKWTQYVPWGKTMKNTLHMCTCALRIQYRPAWDRPERR